MYILKFPYTTKFCWRLTPPRILHLVQRGIKRDFNPTMRKLLMLAALRRVRNTLEKSELQRKRNCRLRPACP